MSLSSHTSTPTCKYQLKVHSISNHGASYIVQNLSQQLFKCFGRDSWPSSDYKNYPYFTFSFAVYQEALLEGYKTLLNDKIRPAMNREFDPAETGVDVLIVDDPYGGGGFYFGPSSNETATSGFNPGRFMYDGSKPKQMYVYSI